MKLFRIPRHPVGVVGGVATLITAIALIVLQAIDLLLPQRSPYVGLFANMVMPIMVALSVVVLLIGVLLERRRRKKSPEGAPKPWLVPLAKVGGFTAVAIGVALIALIIVSLIRG